jgi:pimeloyl-ACP methyl ester carboxylesterase
MTTNIPREIVRPGDRRVAVHDLTPDAPADAPVVLFCHAAPGSGGFDPDPSVTAAHGVRLISLDRPGYGGSDPLREGFVTVGLAADDAAALLEAVLPPGATAGVAGWSAGGRVGLAMAARRPELVSRVAVLATPAPDDEVPWVGEDNRAALDALRGQPAGAVHAALTEAFGGVLGATGAARRGLGGVADADAAALAGDGVADRLDAMLDDATARGTTGMVTDLAGYTLRPWGFDPADVRAPVLLGYGADDALVPPEHGRWWAARLPAATLDVVPGVGHLVVVPFWDRALTHVSQRAVAPGAGASRPAAG